MAGRRHVDQEKPAVGLSLDAKRGVFAQLVQTALASQTAQRGADETAFANIDHIEQLTRPTEVRG